MPGLLTPSKPGELFVLRNAGNIVPLSDASNSGEGATSEYATNFRSANRYKCPNPLTNKIANVAQPLPKFQHQAVAEHISVSSRARSYGREGFFTTINQGLGENYELSGGYHRTECRA